MKNIFWGLLISPFIAIAQPQPQHQLKATACHKNLKLGYIQVTIDTLKNGYLLERSISADFNPLLETVAFMRNPFIDRTNAVTNAAIKQQNIYYRIIENRKIISNIAIGRACLLAALLPIRPYQPLKSSPRDIDFQWSALYAVQQYQLQVAKTAQNYDITTGFDRSDILLDTVLTINNFTWQSPVDSFYWSIKRLATDKQGYFSPPTATKIVARFASEPTLSNNLELSDPIIKNGEVAVNIRTSQANTPLELNYFVSPNSVFTTDAQLIAVQAISPNLSTTERRLVKQKIDVQNLSGYIIIVPTVNGVFLNQQAIRISIR